MTKKSKSPHPLWATKQRTPGTELRLIRGNYYLYEYKTIYDKERKKPRKITGKLIPNLKNLHVLCQTTSIPIFFTSF